MAQACTVSHADNKRSLPAWMLKACSVNEAPKTKDQNKEALESSVKIGVVDQTNPIKRKTGRHLKNVDSEGASELVGLQRCEGREKARRKSKAAVKDDIEEIRDVTIKKERKASEGAALKNNRKRKLENIKSEASSPVSIDDDIELTVEDLVSIAEEYVNADKQKQHELEAVKGTRHKEHLPCPAFLTEADTGVSVVNAPPMKGLLQCTTVESNTRSGEHRGDENKSHQELRYSSSLETTEDVAQDMLNLFLGHLWNKPAGNAKKSEPVESITRTTDNHVPEETGWHSEVPKLGESVKKTMPLESMTTTINHVAEKDRRSEQPKLAEPVKKSMPLGSLNTTMNHVPEKKDWRSELPKLGEPVITKKKSSLRDKVALFL